MGLSNKRPHRLNYAVNKKSANKGGKVEKAIKHHARLQKRIAVEGSTLWLINAMKFVTAKLKKYSINLK